ncbi:hypothetical protein TL16_g01295 [Triparma laevis f. inornata]|nr:hypothetical protein TL16_g01295 [Triparma laevis f. inornata]
MDVPLWIPLIAQAFLSCYSLTCVIMFQNAVWWHFLNPTNLGFDIMGAGAMAFSFLLLPALGYCIGRKLGSSWEFMLHPLMLIGVYPVILTTGMLGFTTNAAFEGRTVLSTLACGSSFAGHISVLLPPVDQAADSSNPSMNKVVNGMKRNWGYCFNLGLLLLLAVRQILGSSTPNDLTGDLPRDAANLLSFALAALFSTAIIWRSQQPTGWEREDDVFGDGLEGGDDPFLEYDHIDLLPSMTDDKEEEEEDSVGDDGAKTKTKPSPGIFSAAFTLSSCFTLTHSFFNNSGAATKFVGIAPFSGHSVGIFILMILGTALPELPFVRRTHVQFGSVMAMMVGCALMFFAEVYAGCMILALGLPSAWRSAAAVAIEDFAVIGKWQVLQFLSFGGLLIFVHQVCYVGVMMYSHVPVVGPLFGGHSGVWGLMVVAPFVLSMAWRTLPPTVWKAMSVRKLGSTSTQASHAKALSLLLVSICIGLPSVMKRSLNTHYANPLPSSSSLKVMTYNNQNGYTTSGVFNGYCYVDVINSFKPDYVVIPEGDSMHANTGNRDAVDFYSSKLGKYHVNFGPAGNVDAVSVAAMSTRKFEEEGEIVQLPKPTSGDLNRFMLVDHFVVGGQEVIIAGTHFEWFGDPTTQTQFVVDYFEDHDFDSVPVIVTGDFNLEPCGGNMNAPDATAFVPFIDSGWDSVTPMQCSGPIDKDVGGHLCDSNFTTAVIAEGGSEFPSMRY